MKLIAALLEGRQTKLQFNDFLLQFLTINNRISQGCPLSIIIYILYNADLVEIPKDKNEEDAIRYVDEVILVAIGDTFEEMVQILKDMMEQIGGGFTWSSTHNLWFKIMKVAVMHLSRAITCTDNGIKTKQHKLAPALIVNGNTI